MNYRMICNIIGKVVCVEALFLLPALAISLACGETRAAEAFAVSAAIMLALALPFVLKKPKENEIYAREGLVTVGLMWVIVSLLGALPLWLSGAVGGFVDCLFETVSGFTTTGSSILTDIEALPRGVLYWRSFTNWLGGMGVLVFVLILNPLSAKDSGENMHLLRAESPGVKITKLVPRMRRSAEILYVIYFALSLLLFLLLLLGGVSVYEALVLTFSTAGTGGFCIFNASLGAYGSYVQWVVTLFMLLFGVNFNLYFLLLIGGAKRAAKNEELHVYLAIAVVGTLAIMLNLRRMYPAFGELLRTSAFQVVSILSTTGFSTADFDRWPEFSKTILVLLMFVGGCGGSTGGGLKVSRIMIAFRAALRSVRKMLHPNLVQLVELNGEPLDERTVNTVQGHVLLHFLLLMLGTLLISVDGANLQSNFTAVLSCLGNIGPGLDLVGPAQNFAGFSVFSKLILSVMMLIGRLELFPILALFLPAAWRKRR